jgi:dihydroorotate dehydrogenase
MVESKREVWHDIVKRAEGAGADGLELNFGCPHGMSERGMGSAVGQVPEYSCMITEWAKEAARTPVMVKLTPNVTDIRLIARAAKRGRADGLSAINTINSITGIDLETLISRCSSVDWNGQRMMGLNNIELISDRPIEDDLGSPMVFHTAPPHPASNARMGGR